MGGARWRRETWVLRVWGIDRVLEPETDRQAEKDIEADKEAVGRERMR